MTAEEHAPGYNPDGTKRWWCVLHANPFDDLTCEACKLLAPLLARGPSPTDEQVRRIMAR